MADFKKSVKPIGARTVPRKPWEKDTPPETASLDINQALDTSFPDLEEGHGDKIESEAR